MLASTLIRALTAAPLRRPGKSWPSCRPPRVGRILPRPPHPVKRRAEEARGWGPFPPIWPGSGIGWAMAIDLHTEP